MKQTNELHEFSTNKLLHAKRKNAHAVSAKTVKRDAIVNLKSPGKIIEKRNFAKKQLAIIPQIAIIENREAGK